LCVYAQGVSIRVSELRGVNQGRRDEMFADDYGVRADGSDQTAALTSALATAASRGRSLVLPPGIIFALDVPVPANTTLRGYGPASVLRRPATGVGGLSDVLRITGSNVSISDLKIDGNRAALAQADNRGVIDGFTAGVSNIVIERCWITEGAEKGIRYVNQGSDFVVRGCRITNIDEDAIIIQQTTQDGVGVEIVNNRIDTCAGNGIMARGSNDGTTWFQLVNSTTSGVANLQQVFGTDLTALARDWATSVFADDAASTDPRYQQPSWNLRSIFGALESTGDYPLATATLGASPMTVSVDGGSAAYLRFAVSAGQTATVQLSTLPSNVQLTLVRTR